MNPATERSRLVASAWLAAGVLLLAAGWLLPVNLTSISPALLHAAGVAVSLIDNGNGAGDFNARNMRQEAGNAVAYGLPWDEALRAITLGPAEAFGVADRLGSLGAGKSANVVVWSGDPFEFGSRAERVYIRGVLQTGKSRQDELAERYRKLPPAWRNP